MSALVTAGRRTLIIDDHYGHTNTHHIPPTHPTHPTQSALSMHPHFFSTSGTLDRPSAIPPQPYGGLSGSSASGGRPPLPGSNQSLGQGMGAPPLPTGVPLGGGFGSTSMVGVWVVSLCILRIVVVLSIIITDLA